jgi:hypothetical protein
MSLKTVFTANAVVALVFGLLFLIVPGTGTGIYGAELSDAGLLVTRLFGATVLGYCVLTWLARNAEESEARNAIVTSLFIGWGIGFVVALIFQIQGVINIYGWVNVALYLLFTLGYGYFQFVKS